VAIEGIENVATKEVFFMKLKEAVKSIKATKKSTGAIKELLFPVVLSLQSVCIKFGNTFQDVFNDVYGSKNDTYKKEFLKWSNEKGLDDIKELDYLENIDGVMYHFEMKCNINLDTEKLPAVENRVKAVENFFKEKYPDIKIISAIFAVRNPTGDIAKKIVNKIYSVPVFGYKEVFSIFGIDITEEEWKETFRQAGDIIAENNGDL